MVFQNSQNSNSNKNVRSILIHILVLQSRQNSNSNQSISCILIYFSISEQSELELVEEAGELGQGSNEMDHRMGCGSTEQFWTEFLPICKGWLAIAKLKPLSLFISLLTMLKKAIDNVKIKK